MRLVLITKSLMTCILYRLTGTSSARSSRLSCDSAVELVSWCSLRRQSTRVSNLSSLSTSCPSAGWPTSSCCLTLTCVEQSSLGTFFRLSITYEYSYKYIINLQVVNAVQNPESSGFMSNREAQELGKGPGLYYRLEGRCNFRFGTEQNVHLTQKPL